MTDQAINFESACSRILIKVERYVWRAAYYITHSFQQTIPIIGHFPTFFGRCLRGSRPERRRPDRPDVPLNFNESRPAVSCSRKSSSPNTTASTKPCNTEFTGSSVIPFSFASALARWERFGWEKERNRPTSRGYREETYLPIRNGVPRRPPGSTPGKRSSTTMTDSSRIRRATSCNF